MSDTIHLNDDLNAVEYENDTTLPRKLFIENILYDTVIFIFIVFVIFNSIYVYSGILFPSSLNETTVYYPLIQDYSNDEATVKILLQPLHTFHKFIIMDGKALRHSVKYPIENNLIISGKLIYLKDGIFVKENIIPQINITNYFKIGSDKSSEFHVFYQPIYSSFNGLNISLLFKTGFYNIRGFEFTYTFSDTSSIISLTNTGIIILFSTACYALISYIISLKGTNLSDLQLYSIILGIAAVLAPNPLALLINNRFISFLSIFSPVVFLAVFRSFQIYISITILNRKNRFSQNLTKICLVLLVIYENCEFFVSKHRSDTFFRKSVELTSLDSAIIIMHIFYSFAICSSFGYNFYSTSHFATDKIWHFKSVVYGIFSLATAISTLVAEVVLPLSGLSNDSKMRNNLYLSSHIFVSVVLLFLHHPVKKSISMKDQILKIESTVNISE